MNFVSRNESQVIIRQVSVLLWLGGAVFILPLLGYALIHILGGTWAEVDGVFFCLFLGLVLLWVWLEFVAPRERITINFVQNILTRNLNGVFKRRKQVIDLLKMKGIKLEFKETSQGNSESYPHLFIYGSGEEHLLNRPSLNLNYDKLGKIISETTGIKYDGRVESN